MDDNSDLSSVSTVAIDLSDDDMENVIGGSENYDEYEDIYNDEVNYNNEDEDKINFTYYIGICKYIPREKRILFLISVSSRTFLKYSFERIRQYMIMNSCYAISQPKIHILKLHILEDDTYSVIIKTHWLRLIQRHWKRVFIERREIWRKRMLLASIMRKERTGRYPEGLNRMPGLNGLLKVYSTTHPPTHLMKCH
jgi:hypothetical protein